eukprot:CAMPEP_0172881702 /NCGR_PEP_ID=MMETSP1075-20121228/118183_1 /TAXON_ID=2916 /ORGANISM="Ceratium fusus, Strain PA161109" /LENGTH=38 /DNA_ID= /DNA_START= /DNA_END= /DNA_ORIENTATION=
MDIVQGCIRRRKQIPGNSGTAWDDAAINVLPILVPHNT